MFIPKDSELGLRFAQQVSSSPSSIAEFLKSMDPLAKVMADLEHGFDLCWARKYHTISSQWASARVLHSLPARYNSHQPYNPTSI